MDLSAIGGIDRLTITSPVLSDAIQSKSQQTQKTNQDAFAAILQSATDMLNETNHLQKAADEAKIQFALGNATSTHDLSIAQQKAQVALQYTVTVRDRFIEAYKEIMNIQI